MLPVAYAVQTNSIVNSINSQNTKNIPIEVETLLKKINNNPMEPTIFILFFLTQIIRLLRLVKFTGLLAIVLLILLVTKTSNNLTSIM
jgi:hypothetical protein